MTKKKSEVILYVNHAALSDFTSKPHKISHKNSTFRFTAIEVSYSASLYY